MIYFPTAQLSLQQCAEGVIVSQHQRAYLARDWQLTESVLQVVDLAMSYGLDCMIRDKHPRPENRLENGGSGVVHLGFSTTPTDDWVFVLNPLSRSKKDPDRLLQVTFNKSHACALKEGGVLFGKEWSNNKHLETDISLLTAALSAVCHRGD